MIEMNEEKWNDIKMKVGLWFENHESWEDEHVELLSVNNLILAGDTKPNKRGALYSAIRTCFSDIEDKPFTTGKKSLMPLEVQAFRDGQLQEIKSELTRAYLNCEAMQLFLVKHKRSGGGGFQTPKEFAMSIVDSTRLRMNTAYNAHVRNDKDADYTWDGTNHGLECHINGGNL